MDQNIFPFGNQEYLTILFSYLSENLLLFFILVTVRSEFNKVLQFIRPTVLN
jgi:hypothetical protein